MSTSNKSTKTLALFLVCACSWAACYGQGGGFEIPPLAQAQSGTFYPPAIDHVDIPDIGYQQHQVLTAVVVQRGTLEPIEGGPNKNGWFTCGIYFSGPDGAVLAGADGFLWPVKPNELVEIIDLNIPGVITIDETSGARTTSTTCTLDGCGRGERFCGRCVDGIATCNCVNGTHDQTVCKSLGGTDGRGGSYTCSVTISDGDSEISLN